ncbi:MAG: hypothetical protein Q9162_006009 [Coniocarpon cinnabarinum]
MKASQGEQAVDTKKPRRSQRLSQVGAEAKTPLKNSQLPSPLTHNDSTATTRSKDGTVTPPEGRPSQIRHRTPPGSSPSAHLGLLSPGGGDTQPFSQVVNPADALSSQVGDEEAEGVWGYLLPLDDKFGQTLVLKERAACPLPETKKVLKQKPRKNASKSNYEKQEEAYEDLKIKGISSGGYLIGRHPECDRVLKNPHVSNRHCLIFKENKGGYPTAIVEDLSGNGTFVNEAFVGRNKRRELKDGDELAILDETRCVFRYPRHRQTHGFNQQYSVQEQLGKGHFATVYLAVERCSGMKFAVKKFEKRTGPGEKSKVEGLQQEIAVLMGVSHPNLLCLKDTFDEDDGVYIVLELATEGELFNWIVMKGKLSEQETRRIFIQLFQGLKYLHERNIVHRDIKPENILLVDQHLSIKVADFGLAKIIGEESFTTTLCGTPSYVAPEILENSNHRRYTRAVDVWSLGVVLYICLCGFPPFSDELCTPENPYNLSQQIKTARFDYPSPYWDPVSDLALDLIDRMLMVDAEKRLTIDECLQHPWVTQRQLDPADSTESLTGAMHQLDFSKRKPVRERTLLSSLNDVHVTRTVPVHEDGGPKLKIFEKNQADKKRLKEGRKDDKARLAKGGDAEQFVQIGDGNDPPVYSDEESKYPG